MRKPIAGVMPSAMSRLASSKMAKPEENHLRVASVIYLQRQKYSKARPILEQLVAYFPGKKEYFSQLGAVYSEQGKERDSFAMLAMAYDNKLGLNGSELIRFAQLYRMYEFPYEGATIIESGLANGKLKRNLKTCQELGDAYFQAREMKKAMNPLQCAARASGNGEICCVYVRCMPKKKPGRVRPAHVVARLPKVD